MIVGHFGEEILLRKYLGDSTNNRAEYTAVRVALEWILGAVGDAAGREVLVRTDSQLVVKQMGGEWRVKDEALWLLFEEVSVLVERVSSVTFEWVKGHDGDAGNEVADRLVREARDGRATDARIC